VKEPVTFATNLLLIAASAQLAVAVLNLFLVRLLKWREELLRLPLLLREVFQVHKWFISVSLTIFAVLTWRFVGEIARHEEPVFQWLAGCIGIFWAIRTVLQIAYYSSSHWRGKFGRTLIHIVLLAMYGGLAGLYLWMAAGRAWP
jgi:hypothetical protein